MAGGKRRPGVRLGRRTARRGPQAGGLWCANREGRGRARRLLLGLGALVGLWLSWSAERASLERGNRLHRAGDAEGAAGLYEARSREGADDDALRYNLGTALIEAGDPTAAETELVLATRRGDPCAFAARWRPKGRIP